MKTVDLDRNGLQVLSREECLALLEHSRLGRVGITIGALPTILPVNYRLIDERIIFRTGSGTKLEAATTNQVVAFEVDDMDPLFHSGWSVVVTGQAAQVDDPDLLERILDIPRWAPVGADRLVGIKVELVSGRRIVPGIRVGLGPEGDE